MLDDAYSMGRLISIVGMHPSALQQNINIIASNMNTNVVLAVNTGPYDLSGCINNFEVD